VIPRPYRDGLDSEGGAKMIGPWPAMFWWVAHGDSTGTATAGRKERE
jgi:hypothetical protein